MLTGAISRELILGVAFILGIARAFEVTVMQIMVPSLVPLPLVPRAVAGSATANQTATIAGPGARRLPLRGRSRGRLRRLPRAVRRRRRC